MSRHDPTLRLRHMLDHAREAVELAQGRSRENLERDRTLELALVRLLEIVGEAAARIPEADRARWPSIAWPDIVGLRNRVVHGYDTVNFDIVWATIQNDLPPLVAELRRILQAGDE